MTVMELNAPETSHESGGYIQGAAIGIVTQNKDPDQMCRVKVRFPWHENPSESYWARLATPMAGKDRGLVTIPEVGDECILVFERSDLRFGIVVGSVHNGKDKPPYANADGNNNIRIFKSRSGHTLTFDDGTPGIVEAKHKSGKHVKLFDDGVLLEDEKGNKFEIDSNSGAINISATGTLTIKAATITIESNATMEVKAGATMTVRGSLVNIN